MPTNVKQYLCSVTTKLIVTVDEDKTDIESVLSDMDYNFDASGEDAEVVTTEITGWEIKDSRDDTILV